MLKMNDGPIHEISFKFFSDINWSYCKIKLMINDVIKVIYHGLLVLLVEFNRSHLVNDCLVTRSAIELVKAEVLLIYDISKIS